MARRKLTPDVNVENHGSIFIFTLLSEAAKVWVEENVQEEAFFMPDQLAVEHRYAWDLKEGMEEAGLVLR